MRRYDGYEIITVGRPDICNTILLERSGPVFDKVQLVYLWKLNRNDQPFDGEESEVDSVQEHFTLASFTDYIEKEKDGTEQSPWSESGYLGGSWRTRNITLLPPDLDRVFNLLSNRNTSNCINWDPDNGEDIKALGAANHFAEMGDWSPDKISYDSDACILDWECEAARKHRYKASDMSTQWIWRASLHRPNVFVR